MPSWLLPPNLITYVRLVLAPMAALAIVDGRHQQALLLVLVAGASEGLDGFLARQFHWRTRLGSYIDPLADKLLLLLTFIALTVHGTLPVWLLIFFLLRDLWILGMVAFAWYRTPIRTFPPRLLGKATTLAQILMALAFLVSNAYPGQVPANLTLALFALTVALTAVSAVDYTMVALRRYRAWRVSGIM